MKLIATLTFALTSAAVLVAAAPTTGDVTPYICPDQVLVSETYIGEDKHVKLQTFTCPLATESKVMPAKRDLESRQTNVCGNTCQTFCFPPSGGGPNPNDCHVIANALRFDSQNIGALFEIGSGTNNTVALQYSSCLSFYVNQDPFDQLYCRTAWAGVIDWVAPNCQATQNAHGGLCVATDQQFFIQVQHS
ncbi:hypothetical protein GYMLUDRAFT_241285 [Collybiopsis luxurians FD-317 M1]|uniref:Uncharacterized protein n=1 Tax=Collybiopsis luxurians FD-317 M1 TaxID=944289 RepID=A0A0D0BIY1_9AGAR|nr:hypothetical protein GYMLUDRAFT_241285 [Collybiopsis luxurians FD-317 M1]